MTKGVNFRKTTLWLTLTAVFTAMNIALSSFGIPVPGGHLYFNDVVICTAAILFDPLSAFIVGGVGAFLGDLFFYPAPMFVSLVTHGIQAVVISVFSHYVLKKKPVLSSGIGVTLGALINIVGYSVGRMFFYGDKTVAVMIAKLPFQALQAVGCAILAMYVCWVFGIRKLYLKMTAKHAK